MINDGDACRIYFASVLYYKIVGKNRPAATTSVQQERTNKQESLKKMTKMWIKSEIKITKKEMKGHRSEKCRLFVIT